MVKQLQEPLYERLKRRFLNSRLIAALIFMGITIGFLASMKESILKILPSNNSTSKLTLVATVIDQQGYCGEFGFTPDGKDKGPMIQKATLDLAINNPSSGGHIITALVLDPGDLHAGFWAGELTVGGVYHVVLDEWHNKLMEANMNALELGLDESQAIPPKLPAINVREIVDKKYAIEGRSQERFQVRLGLRRSIDFLYGTVRVTVKTDRGAEVTSEPLSVVVCTPGSALKSAP